MDDVSLKSILALLGIFISSTLLLIRGFVWIKRKRIIENTPTSKIDTAAIGSFTEIIGRCFNHSDKRVIAPISSAGCAAYIINIQKLVKRGRSSSWVQIAQFYSDEYLFIDDRSKGLATVRINDLNLENWSAVKRKGTGGFLNKKEDRLIGLKKKYKELDNIIRSHRANRLRYTEYRIARNKKIYTLGTSEAFSGFKSEKMTIQDKIKTVIGNESDFKLDSEISKRVKLQFARSSEDGVLLKLKKVYFSDLSQKDLIHKKGTYAFLFICAGTLGMIGTLSVIILSFINS